MRSYNRYLQRQGKCCDISINTDFEKRLEKLKDVYARTFNKTSKDN